MTRTNMPAKTEGSFNTRELGGYPAANGYTKCNAFLRSDKLSNFTSADVEMLYQYGVRLVVDLRSEGEVAKEPCAMIGYQDVKYTNVPLLDNINSGFDMSHMPNSLLEIYIGMLEESKEGFAKVFRAFLSQPEVCVIYNCTGGKDRTGIISMLLLQLAGVPDNYIVADYAATYPNLQRNPDTKKILKMLPKGFPLFLM